MNVQTILPLSPFLGTAKTRVRTTTAKTTMPPIVIPAIIPPDKDAEEDGGEGEDEELVAPAM